MMHMGDIMSTVEGVQYHGGNLLLFEYPMVLNTPHSTQISKDGIPHGTEHPHGTHDIPHMHHDIPHGTEHPPQYSR